MGPVSLLFPRSSSHSSESLPNVGGIAPVRRLPLRRRTSRFLSRPNAGGMSPVNWLPSSSSQFNADNLASSAGILPASLSHVRFKPITRSTFSSGSVATPSHSLTGTRLSQFNTPFLSSVPFTFRRMLKSPDCRGCVPLRCPCPLLWSLMNLLVPVAAPLPLSRTPLALHRNCESRSAVQLWTAA